MYCNDGAQPNPVSAYRFLPVLGLWVREQMPPHRFSVAANTCSGYLKPREIWILSCNLLDSGLQVEARILDCCLS